MVSLIVPSEWAAASSGIRLSLDVCFFQICEKPLTLGLASSVVFEKGPHSFSGGLLFCSWNLEFQLLLHLHADLNTI